jgi:hypothetical protein
VLLPIFTPPRGFPEATAIVANFLEALHTYSYNPSRLCLMSSIPYVTWWFQHS